MRAEFTLALSMHSCLNKSLIVYGLPLELAGIFLRKNLKEIMFNTPRSVLVSILPTVVCLVFCEGF